MIRFSISRRYTSTGESGISDSIAAVLSTPAEAAHGREGHAPRVAMSVLRVCDQVDLKRWI